MNLALNRLSLLFALLLFPLVCRATTPSFLVGTTSTDAYPYYGSSGSYTSVPVGKTLVVPIAISGSGPMTYTVTSSKHGVVPIIKTGYPVMNIHVTYSGTTGAFGLVYPFTGGTDGGVAYAGLITGTDGDLYGTTETGGTDNFGTAYKITTTGSLTTLYTFTDGTDGANPYAGVIPGAGGLYFGTTVNGGNGFGTVYQVSTTGSFSTLWVFTNGTDGGMPYGGLVTGTDGLLYGTTKTGGAYGFGTVYQLTKSGSLTTLYPFTGGTDGAYPESQLVQGSNGEFYGTTVAGGASSAGTVFEITNTGSLTTLHAFTSGSDGGSPYAGLIAGESGLFYGTTEAGASGYGTVYEMTTSGSVVTLHAFTGPADGGNPFGGVLLASDGNLYGTTETDGSNNFGTIYQVTSSGSFATLYTFTGGSDGGHPYAALVEGGTNDLFGTTTTGGADNKGTIFQIPLPNVGQFSGTMKFALLRDVAPKATGYIGGYAQAGYYNGLDFFRISNLEYGSDTGATAFIAQGGDPTNTGTSSPTFTYDNEYSPSLVFSGAGQLALANSGIDPSTLHGTNGSQFFISQGPSRFLDFSYTVFGQLISGFDVMSNVMSVPLKTPAGNVAPSSPVSPVEMDSVTVSEDNTDAILLLTGAGYLPNGATITVSAKDPSGNKAVTTSGTTNTPNLSFSMSTTNDTSIDPPFIEPVPNYNLALHQKVTIPFKTVDLDFNYLTTSAFSLSYFSSASVKQSGNSVTVAPGSGVLIDSVDLGFFASQPFVGGTNVATATVGLGMGSLTAVPALLTGTPGGLVAATGAGVSGSAIGTFIASNPQSIPADFTTTVNWGDGTLTTGTADTYVVNSSRYPTGYDVVAPSGHSYANPGVYPVNVTISDSNGGILQVNNTAVVSAGPIYASGRTFTAGKGLANGLVGTFVDSTAGTTEAKYKATINWGDGAVGQGTVHGSGGNFEVYGKHQYSGGTTYPVDVTISATNGNTGYAWSVAQLTGVPSRQPPISQSHITGEVSNPGYNGNLLDEEVTLVNSGNLPSGPITLRFYLSPDSSTDPINSAAIQLAVGNGSTYNTPSIAPGAAIQGSVSNIALPSNVVAVGKYIIMEVITSDPIANHLAYPHAFADPYPLVE
jgi:uncharacterized repeat protein (TIGR03803 family)